MFEGETPEVFSRSEELIGVGLDVPEITRVAGALADVGIDIGRDVYTVKFAFGRLTEYLESLKGGAADE